MNDILPVGERIKRIRIFKNLTLKEVCNDNLSVSKLSCIENNKILPSDDVLKYLSDFFSIELSYFTDTIEMQINKNIEYILSKEAYENYHDLIMYNVNEAIHYKLFDTASEIINTYFNILVYKDMNVATDIIPLYSTIFLNCTNQANIYNYYLDMQKFYFHTAEHYSSIDYYELFIKNDDMHEYQNIFITSYYYYVLSSIETKNYTVFESFDDKLKSIDKNNLNFINLINLKILSSFLFIHENDIDSFEKIYSEIRRDISSNDFINKKFLKYTVKCVSLLLEYEFYDNAKIILDKFILDEEIIDVDEISLILKFYPSVIKNTNINQKDFLNYLINISISTNNAKVIYMSYFYKFKYLYTTSDISSAEIYLDVCIDFLLKHSVNIDVVHMFTVIAKFYKSVGENEKSFSFYLKAKDYFKKITSLPFINPFIN